MGKKDVNYEKLLGQYKRRISKQKPMIGIDIGSSQLKIIGTKSNIEIKKWASASIPEGYVNQGRIEAQTPMADLIKRTLSRNKIKGRKCSLCISGNDLIVRELTLPEMGREQILENINYEIISFLPLKHSDYTIDYKILEFIKGEEGRPNKLRLMVAAIPTQLVNQYITTLKKAGLKVAYVDIVPNAISKMNRWIAAENSRRVEGENVCIIDFGARFTDVVILKDGDYFTHKTIIRGSRDITKLISDRLEIDFDEAEDLKINSNFFENNIRNLSTDIIRFYDYLLTDIDRTIGYFKNRNHGYEINKIYLTGGGSLQHGLNNYFNNQLTAEVILLSDDLRQYKSKGLNQTIALFSQAIGVTIREDK